MRIIRTEMYFEDVEDVGPGVSKAARMNPGVGVAFLNVESPANFPFGSILKKPIVVENTNEREVRRFLDLAVRGTERSYGHPYSKYWQDEVHNGAIVDFIMNANIIVEQSPPSWETFKTLVSKSPGIGIGTFVGFQLAGAHTELMILTVPIGIVVVSSAIGISEALKKGLNKKVEALFKDKNGRRQKLSKPSA
jgi:hypothetical protein